MRLENDLDLVGLKSSGGLTLTSAVLLTSFLLLLRSATFTSAIQRYKSGGYKEMCRLSLLTNSGLVYEPKCGRGGVAGSQPMSTAVHIT